MNTIEQLIQATTRYYHQGWTPATSSNFSLRALTQDTVHITRSGKHKGMLTPNDFMQITLSGEVIDAGRPSAETQLHLLIYQYFASAQAVLHTHSPKATVLSLASEENTIRFEGYEVLKAFPGFNCHTKPATLRIFDNSQDIKALAKDIKPHLDSFDLPAFLIRGHGLYVWGETLFDADRHLEAMEYLFECEFLRRQIQ